jgi:hypothetical protein
LGLLMRLAPELAALLRLAATAQRPGGPAGRGRLRPAAAQRPAPGVAIGAARPDPGRQGQGRQGGAGWLRRGLDLAWLFQFEWQAVLGDQPLSPADLAALQRAAALKRPLVRLRGQWALVDASAVAGLLRLAG